jgi:hypothetical protein
MAKNAQGRFTKVSAEDARDFKDLPIEGEKTAAPRRDVRGEDVIKTLRKKGVKI